MCSRPPQAKTMSSKKICPSCKAENSPLAMKCSVCGTTLPTVVTQSAQTQAPKPVNPLGNRKICPACKTANPPVATKCVKCGTLLGS